MSVIAWDGLKLAADKQASDNPNWTVTKIFKIKGHLYGFSGRVSYQSHLLEWIKAGKIPDLYPEFQKTEDLGMNFIEITPTGKIFFYGQSGYPMLVEEDFFAIGSGGEIAIGAMYAGGNALTAVNAASHYNNSCGMGMDVLTLGD